MEAADLRRACEGYDWRVSELESSLESAGVKREESEKEISAVRLESSVLRENLESAVEEKASLKAQHAMIQAIQNIS